MKRESVTLEAWSVFVLMAWQTPPTNSVGVSSVGSQTIVEEVLDLETAWVQ